MPVSPPPGTAAAPSTAAVPGAEAGAGYWTDPTGRMLYRAADGRDYAQGADGRFLPISPVHPGGVIQADGTIQPSGADLPAAAGQAGAAGQPSPASTGAVGAVGAASPSAADDRSTYYEYIAAHTGEQPVRRPMAEASTAAAAPAGSRRGRVVWVGLAALAVAALVAAGIYLILPQTGPEDVLQPSAPPSSAAEPSSPAPSEEPSTTPTGTGAPAAEQLAEIAAGDHQTVAGKLDGHWVVQLSAKQEGLRTAERTWTSEDILAEFEATRRQHEDAVLIDSSQWTSFQLDDYWITALATPYDTADEALAVCRDLGIDRENCFAKKISSTQGPEGTTKLNP